MSKKKITPIHRMRGSEPKKTVRVLGNLDVPEHRMQTNCTVAECVQISLAAAQDIVTKYIGEINKLVIQQTIYLEGIKEYLKSHELLNDEEFSEMLKKVSEDYSTKRQEYLDKVLNKEDEQVSDSESEEEVAEDEAVDTGSNGSN